MIARYKNNKTRCLGQKIDGLKSESDFILSDLNRRTVLYKYKEPDNEVAEINILVIDCTVQV